MSNFQIPDFTTMSEQDVQSIYRAAAAEINRRYDISRIPQEISNLAQQGRDAGVDEATMVDAVTREPDPEAGDDSGNNASS